MGMCGKRNTWLSCFVAHAQHKAARTTNMGAELGKEANSVHVPVTENQQDREDSGRDVKLERWKGDKGMSKESSRRKQTAYT